MTNEPSPRPWSVDGINISDANGEPVTPLYFNEQDEANAALIVAAVNEYSPVPKTEMLADAVSANIALVDERDRLRDIVRRAIPFVEGIVNAGAIVNADDPDVVPFLTKEQKAAARKAHEEAVPLLRDARAALGEDKE